MTEGGLGSSPRAGGAPRIVGQNRVGGPHVSAGHVGGCEPGLTKVCMVDVFHSSAAVLRG